MKTEEPVTFKSLKVRLYPTVKQRKMLDNHFNAYRFCYNLCLQYKSLMWDQYKINKSGYDMQSELFEIRKETDWLLKCKAECIREAALKVEKTFKSFFTGSGYPNFKRKRDGAAFYAHQNITIKHNKLSFYGYKIKFKTSIEHTCLLNQIKIKTVTFYKDSAEDYFASCLIGTDKPNTSVGTSTSIGIDLGLKDLIITSEGIKYPNNRYLQSTAFKMAKLQCKFSRTQKGSSNRNKLRIKISRLHRKAVRQREHYYHQITNELIRDNQTIVLENLNIKNMVKNHSLARSISDVSWGLLIRQLEYKAIRNGRNIIKIDQWYPSTKTCSGCGSVKDIPLSERVYNCECGLSLDRDINAAINIRNAGLKIPGVLMEGVGIEPVEVRSNSLIINN